MPHRDQLCTPFATHIYSSSTSHQTVAPEAEQEQSRKFFSTDVSFIALRCSHRCFSTSSHILRCKRSQPVIY